MMLNEKATVNSNMLPHGPRCTTIARARSDPPRASQAANVIQIAARDSGLGEADSCGPLADALVWLVTKEPLTAPA